MVVRGWVGVSVWVGGVGWSKQPRRSRIGQSKCLPQQHYANESAHITQRDYRHLLAQATAIGSHLAPQVLAWLYAHQGRCDDRPRIAPRPMLEMIRCQDATRNFSTAMLHQAPDNTLFEGPQHHSTIHLPHARDERNVGNQCSFGTAGVRNARNAFQSNGPSPVRIGFDDDCFWCRTGGRR